MKALGPFRTLVASLALGLAACSGSQQSDAGSDAGRCTATPPGACQPNSCAHGNELNVGAYCTKGAGQCNAYNNGLLACAIDLSKDGANFCILIGCHANSDCGSNACCTGDPSQSSIMACVPQQCVVQDGGGCPPPPSGTDGGLDGGDGG